MLNGCSSLGKQSFFGQRLEGRMVQRSQQLAALTFLFLAPSFVIFLLFSSISHSTTSSLLFTCGPIHFLSFFYSFFPLVLNFSNEAVRLIFNLICLRHGAWSMGCKPRKTRAVFGMERTG